MVESVWCAEKSDRLQSRGGRGWREGVELAEKQERRSHDGRKDAVEKSGHSAGTGSGTLLVSFPLVYHIMLRWCFFGQPLKAKASLFASRNCSLIPDTSPVTATTLGDSGRGSTVRVLEAVHSTGAQDFSHPLKNVEGKS